MTQTQTNAPQPPAPPPPATGTPSARIGDVTIPLTATPRSEAEVEGLRARREVLSAQLEEATSRRSGLASELQPSEGEMPPAAVRAGFEERIKLLDERIMQIERDIASTDRALASTTPEVLAHAEHAANQRQAMIPEEEATLGAFAAFAGGVVLMLAIGRLRRARRRKGGPADARGIAPGDDPRIDRLTYTVEAMAEELERIGEGQRFVTQLLSNRPEAVPIPREGERR